MYQRIIQMLLIIGVFTQNISAASPQFKSGLAGTYFNSREFREPDKSVDILPNLDVDWKKSRGNDWSAQWQGFIVGPTTGEVKFFVDVKDAFQMNIDGRVAIDGLDESGARRGECTMEKGKRYPVEILYISLHGQARVHLYWQWQGQERMIVPPAAFLYDQTTLPKNFRRFDYDNRLSEGEQEDTGFVAELPAFTGGHPPYANTDYHDGQLRPAVGVHNFEVIRCNRKHPERVTEEIPNFPDVGFINTGFTYNHQPMICYWQDRFWVIYQSGPVHEHQEPCYALITWSKDGRNWRKPQTIFPARRFRNRGEDNEIQYSISHQRMSWYVAPDGRLIACAYYGMPDTPNNGKGVGRAVREILGPGQYGPIYWVRYNKYQGYHKDNSPHYPYYREAPDSGFVKAIDSLLANKLMVQQWYEEDQDTTGDFFSYVPSRTRYGKSFVWYTLPDRRIVGMWKWKKMAIADQWEPGQISRQGQGRDIYYGGAKIWGQRTSDRKYALVYNPIENTTWRHPLSVTTSDDGMNFDTYFLNVQSETPLMRFGGGNKDGGGAQYVRGIVPGNGTPPDGAVWLCYSSNKEDIWVTRVPVPIKGTVERDVHDNFEEMAVNGIVTDWNVYSGVWVPVGVVKDSGNRVLRLRDKAPYNYAKAVRVFPETTRADVSFDLRVTDIGRDSLEIELQNYRGQHPVRIIIDGKQGIIRANAGEQLMDVLGVSQGPWLKLHITADTTAGTYNLEVNGNEIVSKAAFAEKLDPANNPYGSQFTAPTVERIVLRTGTWRMKDFSRYGFGANDYRKHEPDLENPDDPVDEAIYDIDNVRLCRKTPSSARERAIFSPGNDGEAGDIGFIVDTAGSSQAEKGPLEARSGFPTEPKTRCTAPVGPTLQDFSGCVIVTPGSLSQVGQKTLAVLREEIQKRTGIKLETTDRWPDSDKAVIALGPESQLQQFAGPCLAHLSEVEIPGKEGFHLCVRSEAHVAAVVVGKDERGVLYGIGRLLRKMELRTGSIQIPAGLSIVTAPKYPLRGHQLGYRPKTNAYDAWSPAQYDQYIRELALFGTNSIELIPPVSDDEYMSRHMKNPMQMMMRHVEIIDSYGLDVWIWYPNVGRDYVTAAGISKELAAREEVFEKLKRIDHILVPGGDPGRLHPDVFFPFMDRVAAILAKYHPQAKIWVSPQAMQPTREWLDSFYTYVNQKPKWLGGVVFAPWVKTALPEMRRLVSAEIPIRRYPDITHNVACQYPVKDWDLALALTLHRECFNPRPMAMKTIHNALDAHACGSLTYSEGINDDINKLIWGDQDWAPGTSVMETLRDYCRFFISPDFSDELAHGFMAQERNWEGPLAVNGQVDITLAQWQDLERKLPIIAKANYRFQMGLMRAYYDAYIKRRLIYETELERQAMDVLRRAPQIGASEAIDKAEAILQRAKSSRVAQDYKKKCEQLADVLFESIRSQLTVEKHGGQHRTRGAFMDGIDEPLNNAGWLFAQFRRIRTEQDEAARLKALDKVTMRTNPGPGGFYDNLGAPASMKRIVRTKAWKDDPGTLESPRIAFYYKHRPEDEEVPLAWKHQVGTIYETPLRLSYDNLDPKAGYTVRIAYTGRRGNRVRLVADNVYSVHDLIETRNPPVREFAVPQAATADGRLELTWTCGEGQRGAQVSEIWLIRNE